MSTDSNDGWRPRGFAEQAKHKRDPVAEPEPAAAPEPVTAPEPVAPPPPPPGKWADVTGPGITDHWGMPCTDLGAAVLAPNGKLVAVFGDTFGGAKAMQGDWRSPVVLIGTGDAHNPIVWERPGGHDPGYARQLWHYIHDTTPNWSNGGISTVLPSDLLRVGDTLYLHAMVNRGFGNVVWTEIWKSTDSGLSWQHMGEGAKFPGGLHDGFAQCAWGWNNPPTPITPPGEEWGELTFRRLAKGSWILGGFLSSRYALGYRTVDSPVANMHRAPIQLPVTGSRWHAEDHANSRVAQLYGGYVLPGSRLDDEGGVGLLVSQWHTTEHWPYKVMQFRSTLQDTVVRDAPPQQPIDPVDL